MYCCHNKAATHLQVSGQNTPILCFTELSLHWSLFPANRAQPRKARFETKINTTISIIEVMENKSIKIFEFVRPHGSKLFADSKISTLESGFNKLRIRRIRVNVKANPERKSSGFKNIRIHVDGT